MSQITPCIWFDNQAEEAANFYVAVFPDSEIKTTTYYPESAEAQRVSGKPAGTVLTVELTIEGTDFVLLNGGPEFKPNEAISFMVYRDTQEELDSTWYKLIADGGEEGPCGWCKDKFGVSWQVVPRGMDKLLGASGDPEKSKKAFEAMLQMKKIDINKLKEAAEA